MTEQRTPNQPGTNQPATSRPPRRDANRGPQGRDAGPPADRPEPKRDPGAYIGRMPERTPPAERREGGPTR